MLALQLALIFSHVVDPVSITADPHISGLIAVSTAGDAPTGVSATVALHWQSYSVSDLLHVVKVYQDNVLVSSQAPSVNGYTKTIDGYALATTFTNRTTLAWNFRVELQTLTGDLLSVLDLPWTSVYEELSINP